MGVDASGLPSALKMSDLQAGSSTVLEVLERRVDVPDEALPLELFTREGLKDP